SPSWQCGTSPGCLLPCSTRPTARRALPAIRPSRGAGYSFLVSQLDAHAAGGAGDQTLGGLEAARVQVAHLVLGDLLELRLGDLAGRFTAGSLAAGLQLQLGLDQHA